MEQLKREIEEFVEKHDLAVLIKKEGDIFLNSLKELSYVLSYAYDHADPNHIGPPHEIVVLEETQKVIKGYISEIIEKAIFSSHTKDFEDLMKQIFVNRISAHALDAVLNFEELIK